MLYIAHCYKNLRLKYTTIKLYLCGIHFAYMKDGVSCPLTQSDNPCHSRIMTVLKAVKRVQGHSVKLRQPITATILDQICTVLSTGYISDYTDLLLTAYACQHSLDFYDVKSLQCLRTVPLNQLLIVPCRSYFS